MTMLKKSRERTLLALLEQARTLHEPSTRTWWGPYRHMPSGHRDANALTQLDFEGMYAALTVDCADDNLLEPLHKLQQTVAEYAERDPVPLSLVSLRVRRLRGAARKQLLAEVEGGDKISSLQLEDATRTRRVFMLGALRHQQWGRSEAVQHGRVVRFVLDERLLYTDYGAQRPRNLELDADDKRGVRCVEFGETILVSYGEAGSKTLSLSAVVNGKRRFARATIEVVDEEPAPAPDETWSLVGSWSSRGHAFVYRSTDNRGPRRFVIVSEGFPGGYPRDYLYRMLNQHSLLEKMRAAGYDVVLMGYLQGADYIERNADVVDACIREARSKTEAPLIVGGVSMGGLVTRYALTRAETRGLDHQTRLFFTIDTPHTGSYTSIAAQWFAQYFAKTIPLMGLFNMLLSSPANQQFVRHVLIDGAVVTSPLRKSFLKSLADLGDYPQKPKLFAIASGRGDGQIENADATLLKWQGSSLVNAELKAAPDGKGNAAAAIASGHSWLAVAGVPHRLNWADDYCWEDMPGGQNDYGQIIAYAAMWTGCGRVSASRPRACSIPTASALGMTGVAPDEAIPPRGDPRCQTAFDDFVTAEKNLSHVEFSATAAERLLQHVGLRDGASGQG